MLLRKDESSSEKTFHRNFFFSNELKSSEKKESLQDEGSETKFSYQRLP